MGQAVKSVVRFPESRIEIIDAINDLSSEDWIANIVNSNSLNADFNLPFHTLYDDTCIADNPYDCVGDYLYSLKEAIVLNKLIAEIDTLLEKYGPQMSAHDAIADEGWENIINAARDAKKALFQNELRVVSSESNGK